MTIRPILPTVVTSGSRTRRGCALFIKLMNKIENIARRSPKPIKPQHHQLVACI